MLSIILSTSPIEINWHVGQPKPIPYLEINNIIEIQADGHELEFIKDNFSSWIPTKKRGNIQIFNIPFSNSSRVIRWFGDIAKCIVSAI